ncbi:hypothetical protein DTO013E5_6778 [Penicillium roqueforti]|uniref:Uncharacterized protein n=1 Tax=Penicillium roqueforti (strain FM164) TaxID=1365484 RepID=W6R3E8_PENRF|nr:uncharacterized protein LCP9604111_9354 [Penicillium roqueforti]CDM36322.1 unnamed protein product [Penicillium roqueforti FM164]KAF9238712.1 hypothetical protein LCP9604111_9354 [Penicillium roqueforti]KAI1829540.1 hypothetical protein CBS147337_9631 [Penicillium roqueforti]KAI2679865.1 hypothetical protein CBS147355_4347 [Penicillium roqueforti]KAI2684220.1 hypothetical protein LCP963914a_5520 [Penicillium roqueforti]
MAHAESYATLPAARQSKMKIDALLNPGDGDISPRSQHASIPAHRHSYHSHQPSPSFLPASPDYRYSRSYHNSSPGALSSTSTVIPSRSHQMFFTYRSSTASASASADPNRASTSTNQSSLSEPPSPNPYHSRERYSSVSSASSTNGDRRRPPRPKYEEEEMYFIWYHRVDLSQEWKEVRAAFNRQFHDRQRSGFQGIQCKFYRFIKEKKCPTLREQRRMRDGEFLREGASAAHGATPKYGVRQYTNVWYPWMRKEGDGALPLRRK